MSWLVERAPEGYAVLTPALPDTLPAMKQLIDDAYSLPFVEAMALERERSQAHRARVTGEAVAERVDSVVARVKAQSGG
jgi:hypothetical protein